METLIYQLLRRALQRVIDTAQKITGCSLCFLEDFYHCCCLSRATFGRNRCICCHPV